MDDRLAPDDSSTCPVRFQDTLHSVLYRTLEKPLRSPYTVSNQARRRRSRSRGSRSQRAASPRRTRTRSAPHSSSRPTPTSNDRHAICGFVRWLIYNSVVLLLRFGHCGEFQRVARCVALLRTLSIVQSLETRLETILKHQRNSKSLGVGRRASFSTTRRRRLPAPVFWKIPSRFILNRS